MEYGARHPFRSRLLARDSCERRTIKSAIQRSKESELVISCSQCSKMKMKLKQVWDEFEDHELLIQNLANLLEMVYQTYNNLEEECSYYEVKFPYSRQIHYFRFVNMNHELRDQVMDAIAQSNLVMDEVSNLKKRLCKDLERRHDLTVEISMLEEIISELEKSRASKTELISLVHKTQNELQSTKKQLKHTQSRLNAELLRTHTQLEENTYRQENVELKEQLQRFASNERALNTILKETKEQLKKRNEELNCAKSRLTEEADKTVHEISERLPQEFRDLRERVKKSESSERHLSILLQQSREDFKSIKEEMERTQERDTQHAHTIKDNRVLRKELEKSQSNDMESRKLLQQSQEQVNVIQKELEDTRRRLNEANQMASEKENIHSQDTRALKKLLKESQINERALQHQLRQTQDNYKPIDEDFAETKIKEKSNAKDIELNPLLQQSQEHVNGITKELEDTQKRLNEVNQKAQMTEKSLSRKISELQEQINELKLKNGTLERNLRQTREDLRKTTNGFEDARKMLLEANHRTSQTDKSNSQDTSDERKLLEKSELSERALQQQLRDTQDNLKTINEQFAEIKIKHNEALHGIRIQLNDKSKEVSDLRKMLDISKSKEATINQKMQHVQDTLQKTTAELEDTKTRLSKLMGQKLTDNNPNITNLSDKNRPTKLGERFSELYDNEWTDAFEILGSIYKDERTTVITLFTILKDAEKYCREEADKQMERLRKDLTFNMDTGGSDIPSLINKQLKDFRKALATEAGQHLFEVYTKELSQTSSTRDSAKSALRVETFLREAFMLCWLMTIQDPPVVLDRLLQNGEKFNTEIYRSYTNSGPLVDFPVWPTMFLHKGGPVLSKGVAQGCHK